MKEKTLSYIGNMLSVLAAYVGSTNHVILMALLLTLSVMLHSIEYGMSLQRKSN